MVPYVLKTQGKYSASASDETGGEEDLSDNQKDTKRIFLVQQARRQSVVKAHEGVVADEPQSDSHGL